MDRRLFPPGTFATCAGIERGPGSLELESVAFDAAVPLHEPPLLPRDEAVFTHHGA